VLLGQIALQLAAKCDAKCRETQGKMQQNAVQNAAKCKTKCSKTQGEMYNDAHCMQGLLVYD